MLETLKKKANKSHVIRAVLCFVIAAGLLVWTKFAIFQVIVGPVELDVTNAPEAYKGKYVTIDADFFLTDYVEHTTTTTTQYGSSSTSVNGHSYIAFQSIDDYENQSSTWYFYSVYMKRGDQSGMYNLIDDAWAYLGDETGTVAPPEPMKVTGTWTPMEADIESYFRQTLTEMGIVETEYDIFRFYTLETTKIGGVPIFAFWVMNIGALLLLAYSIYNVIGCFTDFYAKKINRYLQSNTSASLAAIEADFSQAHVIGGNTWIGRKWTVFVRGTGADILENRNLIWGYYFRRTGRNSVSEMRLYGADGKVSHLSMTENETKQALQYYATEQPQMIVGYSKELESTYKSNFVGFKDLKYHPAMRTASEDGNNDML